MKKINLLALACLTLVMLFSCKSDAKSTSKTNQEETTSTETEVAKEAVTSSVLGNYVTADYLNRSEGYDWVAVMVKQGKNDGIKVSVRSRADKKRPTCTLDLDAQKQAENVYQAQVKGKAVVIKFIDNKLTIATENEADSGLLNFYCSGGASVAGEYQKIDGDLDNTQLDQTVFAQVLNLQGIGFNVSSIVKDGKTVVTVMPFGLSKSNRAESETIEGEVIGADVEDLNSDGSPELVVFINNPATQKASVLAYSTNNKKSMSMVHFPAIENDAKNKEGYNGYDEFAIVETTLARRFPLFENGEKSGKTRQLSYKLVDGEAMRSFKIVNVTDF